MSFYDTVCYAIDNNGHICYYEIRNITEILEGGKKMKTLTKKLRPAEVKCRCITIPSTKRTLFPSPGVDFELIEGKTAHKGRLDSQFRLRAASWFRRHKSIKPGDEVTFLKDNGHMRISLSRYFSKPENETFGWAQEILDAIKDREINGIVTVTRDGFCVEIGEHVKETQIVFKTK